MPPRPHLRPLVKLPLTVDKILGWADAFHKQHGRWPRQSDGLVAGELTQTWTAVDTALRVGLRGLPGGSSLSQLLAKHRGHRHRLLTPRLSVNLILRWADSHHRQTRQWPHRHSGAVLDAPEENWAAIDAALHVDSRGFRGGKSLAGILARRRGVDNQTTRPALTVGQILTWAEAHHTLFGAWPSKDTGPIGNTGETWIGVDTALRRGYEGCWVVRRCRNCSRRMASFRDTNRQGGGHGSERLIPRNYTGQETAITVG
jgi:hypothetical protein